MKYQLAVPAAFLAGSALLLLAYYGLVDLRIVIALAVAGALVIWRRMK
jgi:hypothetical protein